MRKEEEEDVAVRVLKETQDERATWGWGLWDPAWDLGWWPVGKKFSLLTCSSCSCCCSSLVSALYLDVPFAPYLAISSSGFEALFVGDIGRGPDGREGTHTSIVNYCGGKVYSPVDPSIPMYQPCRGGGSKILQIAPSSRLLSLDRLHFSQHICDLCQSGTLSLAEKAPYVPYQTLFRPHYSSPRVPLRPPLGR